MELKKQSENINRSYNAEGEMTERIDSVQYEIVDDNGNSVGNASIGNGYANANLNISGFSSIAEGEAKLAAMFGIAAE